MLVAAPLAVAPTVVGAEETRTQRPAEVLVPIGGGYEEDTLEDFSREVIEHASGDTVDILVVPSSYGDAPEDREENLELAHERTDQIEAACDRVVAGSGFADCQATLLVLLNRADALDPANSAAFDDRETDGSYLLGGDQTIAMQVLANSPAEEVMADAHDRGVVFGGTSAGAAVESRAMTAGYSEDGWPETGLERDAPLIWWGDDQDAERGLSFGSTKTIYDQHFFQRGRFGRLLNLTAQSVDRLGHGGLLGVGIDYGTGLVAVNDARLGDTFGGSGAAVLDFRTTRAKPRWVGPNDTLSATNILTHVLAPDSGLTYDLNRRVVSIDGHATQLRGDASRAEPTVRTGAHGDLLLGGGDNASPDSAGLQEFVAEASRSRSDRIVIVAAGYSARAEARTAAAAYKAALKDLGWPLVNKNVVVTIHGRDPVSPSLVRGAAGVVFVGGDQALLSPAVSDRSFRDTVRAATARARVTLTDEALTAVMGEWYASIADPTSDNVEETAIEDFKVGHAALRPGLGIVRGVVLEPRFTVDYRWGRLFDAAQAHRSTLAVGISELTALQLGDGHPRVVGERSVTTLDARYATFVRSGNGTVAAANTLLSTFGPGTQLGR